MIKSMTGFATADRTSQEISVSTDIRAYNSKHLDVALRIPSGYFHLEEKIKACIAERIARGRMEVKIQIKDSPRERLPLRSTICGPGLFNPL